MATLTTLVTLVLSGCTGEEPTPIDLHQPASSVTADSPIPKTPDSTVGGTENEASRQQAVDFARQQCLDDPDAEQGVIRIVEPDSQQVVGEVVVACDQVRAEEG